MASGGANLNDSLEEINRGVRGRAQESIHQLRGAFGKPPIVTAGPRSERQARGHQRAHSWGDRSSANDYSYRAAVSKLRDMLKEGEKRQPQPGPPGGLQFSPPRWSQIPVDGQESPHAFYIPSQSPLGGQPRGEIPKIEDVLPVLHQQTGYINQLEGENQYCTDELTQLKMRVAELAADNRRLHEELKRNVVQEILLDDGKLGPQTAAELPITRDEEFQNVQSDPEFQGRRALFGKWQRELERIHSLHETKTGRLEAQLKQAREEAKRYENDVQQLKAKIRTSDSMQAGRGGGFGLCISCAKNEAVVASPSKRHAEAVDRLTRERDELVESLAHLKTRLEEMKMRENDSYEQVKKSIILVEQAGLEKTEAMVHKEQLNDELSNLRARFEEHIAETQNKIAQERVVIRKEFQKEIDDQNMKLKDLSEDFGKNKVLLERTLREKLELQSELEQYKIQVKGYDSEYGQVQDSMKLQMTRASIERNSAVQNMDKLRSELQRMEHDRDQERSCHRSEVDDLRRRLTMAERDLMESKEECIHLTSTIQALERDIHFAKMAKDSLEKGRNDDLKEMAGRAREREEELGAYIEALEAKFTRANADLEEMLSKETNLVHKLTQECHSLTSRLEHVNGKYKKESKSLQSKNEQLTYKLRKTQKRVKDMELQHMEHGHLHVKMREQIKLMDEQAQNSAQQILELLGKQTDLLRDRQQLAKEVEFLRNQVSPSNASDIDKLFQTNKGKVDNILDTLVTKDLEGTTSERPATINTLDL